MAPQRTHLSYAGITKQSFQHLAKRMWQSWTFVVVALQSFNLGYLYMSHQSCWVSHNQAAFRTIILPATPDRITSHIQPGVLERYKKWQNFSHVVKAGLMAVQGLA